MKNRNKKCFILYLLLSFGLMAAAQKGSFTTTSTIGLATPILDSGIGLHLGINPSYVLSPHFSIEGQISYASTKIRSSFLSGAEGHSNSVNTLAGGRLYLSSIEKKNRFYVNALIGLNYNKEEKNGLKRDGEFNVGSSIGAYLELNKFLLGLSFETPENLVLKVGYIF